LLSRFPAVKFDRMKLVRWTRFTWDLEKLTSAKKVDLDPHYGIRRATFDEILKVRNVVWTAFALDPQWGDTLKTMQDFFAAQLDAVCDEATFLCVVATHGSRIIGASVLDASPTADNHLVSGPWVLNEYRNRGLGTALLHNSLLELGHSGLTHAYGVTRQAVLAEKFIYPHFASVAVAYDLQTELVPS
jgi:N-acetylglutamate synthase-like GNAT family acetyltransferase